MKHPILLLSCAVGLYAQVAPAPAPKPPAMPADMPRETVLATLEGGRKLTFGELQTFISLLPPAMQQTALHDRRAFVQQYALMLKLAGMAENSKLDQKSPTKEAIEFARVQVLMNAQLNDAFGSTRVSLEDQRKYYEANRAKYEQVRLKAVYIAFTSDANATGPNGKKYLTEAQALEKAQKLRAEAVAGADFAKLAKENSDDQTSAAKDGEFATIRKSDNVPEAIRSAVFALKRGEISQPVKQPNGYYVFRAEEAGARPFEEVKNDIHTEIQQQAFKAWMDQISRSIAVKYENEAFFAQQASSAASAQTLK